MMEATAAGPGRPPPHGPLDADLELLDRHGTADPTLGLGMQATADLVGLTRGTLYRHWRTVPCLNHDLVRHVLWHPTPWLRRLLRLPTDQPLGTVVGAAVAEWARSSAVLVARTAITSWTGCPEMAAEVAAWERADLADLTVWIDQHLAGQGRRPADGADARTLAIGMCALIEGSLLAEATRGGHQVPTWRAERQGTLTDDVVRFVTATSVPGVGGRTRPTIGAPTAVALRPPPPELSVAQRAILTRVASHLGALGAHQILPTPGRVVEMRRLAAALGVAERSLFRRWPTTRDFNGDLLAHLLARQESEEHQCLPKLLAGGLDGPYASFDHQLASTVAGKLRAATTQGPPDLAAFAVPATDPAVREVWRRAIERTASVERAQLIAILSLAGWQRRPGITARHQADAFLCTVSGLGRLTTSHPDLLEQRVLVGGRPEPLVGVAARSVLRSMADDPTRSLGRPPK